MSPVSLEVRMLLSEKSESDVSARENSESSGNGARSNNDAV